MNVASFRASCATAAPSAPETPVAPAHNIDPDTEQASPASQAAPAQDETTEPELVATPVTPSSPASAEPEQGPVFGDVFNETEVDDDEDRTDTTTPKRKGFLTRTVLPYPTHFWPKPWKRSFKRWAAKRTQEESVEQETPQAAE